MPEWGKWETRWRFILDEPRDGPTNMAIDEVLTSGCARGWSSPSLRLYRWTTPTVSLGYNQPIHGQVDVSSCHQRGVPVVRRPTGGRALLHDQELTYSLALPNPRGSRGVLQDYQWISKCLLLAVRKLGVAASVSRGERPTGGAGGLCFSAASRYELTVNGQKLIGSAQRRYSHAILQQGSLLIEIDLAAWIALFPQAREMAMRATALRCVLGRSASWEELVEAIHVGFEEGAGVGLDVSELTPRELKAAQILVQKQYGTRAWTFRR